jgi:hypothetical protein
MKKSIERVGTLVTTGLAASLGLFAYSGAASAENSSSHNATITAKASPIKYPEGSYAAAVEKATLKWGQGPAQPIHGETAFTTLPNGEGVEVTVFSAGNANPDATHYLPKPNEVENVKINVFPKGTDYARLDAVPEESYEFSSSTVNSKGVLDSNESSASVWYSGNEQPLYSYTDKKGYAVEVTGTNIVEAKGQTYAVELKSEADVNYVVHKMESQSLGILGAIASHHNLPTNMPEIAIPGQ